jgi:protein SCO1
MTGRPWPGVAALVLAALAGVGAFLLLASEPPRLGEVPAFSLTSHDGSGFTRDALAGNVTVVDFIFTRCAEACPAMTEQLGRLQAEAPPGVAFASFTVDPTFDTPAVLARYARDHRARPGWRFVTGAPEALYDLASRGFKLTAMEAPESERRTGDGGPFLHSSKFVLVDGAAQIRGYYDSEDPVARRRLQRDAALVGRFGRLPRINASFNATSAILLLFGLALVRSGERTAHRTCMIGALLCSAAFLASYLVYHAHVGSVRFPGAGALRGAYLTILATHTILAVVIVPLVAVTVTRAARGRFDAHRRIARLTFPLWTYVSVTGVVVYWMLYRT